MNVNNNSNIPNDQLDIANTATFRGKNVVVTSQPMIVTNNEVSAIADISNYRKITIAS